MLGRVLDVSMDLVSPGRAKVEAVEDFSVEASVIFLPPSASRLSVVVVVVVVVVVFSELLPDGVVVSTSF